MEEFSDGVIDTSRYMVFEASEVDGELTFAHPAGSIEGGWIKVPRHHPLEHDFDIQVDFRLEGFVPPPDPDRAIFVALGVGSIETRALIECFVAPPLNCNPGRYSYKAWVHESLNCAPGTKWAIAEDSTAGRFRIRRTRDQVELSYWRDGDWVVLKTSSFSTAPMRVGLYSGSGGSRAAPEKPRLAKFDHLRIETFDP